ncbi:MAG: hypothetical protein AB1736_10505 [Chloroflexota bacterium]
MSRLDKAALVTAVGSKLGARPDPTGTVDLVTDNGHIAVAATVAEARPAIARLTAIDGYRWLVINAADLFAVNPLTIGTKVGIIDATGRVLKNADVPRKK